MSQSKDAAELCALLVDDAYGELTSRIFATLLRRGRLPILMLTQNTRLTPRQLRHGLAVLVQQNLVYHTVEDGRGVYEANAQSAYNLLRSGAILEIIESRYGAAAREVVQNLLLLGHARVGDLAEAYCRKVPQANGGAHAHSNGDSLHNDEQTTERIQSPGHLNKVLVKLLTAGFLQPLKERMFEPPNDTYDRVYKEIKKRDYDDKISGAKQTAAIAIAVRNRLAEMRKEDAEWQSPGKGTKRPLESSSGTAGKRRKLANGTAAVNGDTEDHAPTLDQNLVVRVNYEKCVVALRNQRLVSLASHRIGETTSAIYAKALELLEASVPRCRPDPLIDGAEDEGSDMITIGPIVTTKSITDALDHSIDASMGIGKTDDSNIDPGRFGGAQGARNGNPGKAEDDDLGSATEAGSDMEDGGEPVHVNGNGRAKSQKPKVTFQDQAKAPVDSRSRLEQVKKHLQVLAEDKHRLLRYHGAQGGGQWTVDFNELINAVRETELDNIIAQKFGKTGLRLTRILRQKGKLEDKQLPNLSLMKQKDIRTKLVEMQMAGFVDIQEVPKDQTRDAKKTIHLWYFDMERVSMIVQENILKSMVRCYQRLAVERKNESVIIALTERSDVKGQEQELLSGDQLKHLQRLREHEEKLLAQVARLDSMVGVFRDF